MKVVGLRTLMFWAARKGHARIVRLLVFAGADPNARDQDGDTPLHMAALLGHVEVARLLLEAGADVDARENRFGGTPLHEATTAGVARLLLAYGADVHSQDTNGFTPLSHAAVRGRLAFTSNADSRKRLELEEAAKVLIHAGGGFDAGGT